MGDNKIAEVEGKIISRGVLKIIESAIDIIGSCVIPTLGPDGHSAMYNDGSNRPFITKDGVTVAKRVTSKNKFINAVIKVIKEGSLRTDELVGDGTTSCILFIKVLFNLYKEVAPKLSERKAKELINHIVDELKSHAQKISTDIEEGTISLKQIASISANNNEDIGNMVASAYEQVGKDGIVTVTGSLGKEATLKVVSGTQLDRGYIHEGFIKDTARLVTELDNPLILLFDGTLRNFTEELHEYCLYAAEKGRALFIVATDIVGDALKGLLQNVSMDNLIAMGIKAPYMEATRQESLKDLASIVGAQVMANDGKFDITNKDYSFLGSAEKIRVDKHSTIITKGGGSAEIIMDRVKHIDKLIKDDPDEYVQSVLINRKSVFANKAAVINVACQTQSEMRELKDLYDDSLSATKAVIDGGILSGGGTVLLHANLIGIADSKKGYFSDDFTDDEKYKILEKFKQSVINQLLLNSKYTTLEREEIIKTILKKVMRDDIEYYGYDILKKKYGDMRKLGVVEPTKVFLTAIENARSVVTTLINTRVLLIDDDEQRLY